MAGAPVGFSGQPVARRVVPDFVVEELRYLPSQVVPRHHHANPCLVVLIHGSCVLEDGERAQSACAPGTAVFHPTDELHAYRYEAHSRSRMLAISLPPESGKRFREHGIAMQRPERGSGATITYLARRLACSLSQPDSSQLTIEGLAFELLGEVLCRRPQNLRRQEPLDKVAALLHDRFREQVSLNSIAREVDWEPARLAREFRQRYRITLGEYVRKLRIEHACSRLASSSAPLAELAQELGFFDHSHFCRTFRKLVGVTPSDFRAAHRRR